MKNRNSSRRHFGIFLMLISLVGALSPSESAKAALHLQAGGEGWTKLTLPAPERTQLMMNPAPETPGALPQSPGAIPNGPILAASPGDFVVYDNSALSSAPSVSEVNSPSAAGGGPDIFATYNSYAALSTDHGGTWGYVNPGSLPSLHGGFSGNQDVFYDSSRQLMVWVLQYAPDSTGNALQLAWNSGQTQLETGIWLTAALEPSGLLPGPTYVNSRFDRPRLAQTDNFIYLSANVYDSTGASLLATTVLRFSLDELAAEGAFNVEVFYVEGGFNLTPAQGGTDTFYFARHLDSTHLRVYQWPESADPAQVTHTDVTHGTYVGTGYNCTVTASGKNPCASDDDRLTAGWLWGVQGDPKYLLFAWDAAQSTALNDSLGAHTYPYVRYVKLGLPLSFPTMSTLAESGWSDSSKALFLASAARNARGHAGGTVATAGGTNQPGCSAWISDDYNSGGFQFQSVQTGTNSPSTNAWGAYLTTRRVGWNPDQWLGTCYAIETGVVMPRVIRFARQRDADTNVFINGTKTGSYSLAHLSGVEDSYGGVNSGPAEVTQTLGGNVVSSIRVIYGSNSYSEMMGYPNNTTTEFWFPWYNNTAMNSQFRVSNLGTESTTITVELAGSQIDQFTLGAGSAIRTSYGGQNAGPMHVFSSGGVPILSTIRVVFGGMSYSEMMGYPNASTTDFWFPWYNNTAMNSQLRVSNLGGGATTITVMLAGSQIDQFALGAGGAVRVNYGGQNAGPMQVYSSDGVPILSTIRVVFGGTSYSEMMGYPNATTTDFWFPWYDNVGTNAQVRVSNLGTLSTTITVTLGSTLIDSYSLGAGAAIRVNYAGSNGAALHVASSGGVPILSTVRSVFGGSSFYELMGYPGNALTSVQYFPWYNNTAMDSQVRIGLP